MKINLYFKTQDNLVESREIDYKGKNTSIDEARMIIVNNLERYYHDIKYKINIFTTFTGEKTISVFFEDNTLVKREYLINNLLND